ncbi:MAG: hypothetical protein L6R37_007162 [Teloschistes peruensis]|nr:MAG: hypothetical protein L6R37_007162 [Teloschistes peruensis]
MDPVQPLYQPPVTQTTTPAQSRGGSRRPRRAGAPNHRQMSTNASLARGNPDHSHLTSRDPSLAFLPASVAPSSQPSSTGVSSAEHSGAENPNSKSTRGGANRRGRSARGGRRGNISAVGREQVPAAAVVANQNHDPRATHAQGTITTAGSAIPSRQFGGRLTAVNAPPNAVEDGPSSLSAEAADFQPGQQQHKSRSQRGRGNKTAPPPHPGPRPPYNRQRRDSALKSIAPDIATRTHEDIANSLYECPICTSEIGRNSKAATYPRMSYHPPMHVGARKKLIPDPYQEFRRILAGRLAAITERYRRNALTLANFCAMPGLVRPARTRAQP